MYLNQIMVFHSQFSDQQNGDNLNNFHQELEVTDMEVSAIDCKCVP